jgi:vacuolar-type H+-ATPase subunit E/Vma4
VSDTEKTRGSDTPDTDAELLLEEISAQAQREKAELEARLEGQLRDVGERTETELRRLGEEADRQLRVLLERERGALEGRRRLEEQRKRLAARRARVEAVFAEARRRVEGLRGSDRYPEALKRLIREALEQAGAGAELTVSDAEEELARRLVAELDLRCAIHAREAPLGTVLARSADGLRQVDNGLTGRLDRARDTLEEEVARLLWGTTTI